MTVVKINAIEVPEGAGPELEQRFAARAGAVERSAGFEGFQLLRPVAGEDRYFVMTWWESEAAFEAWVASQDFAAGHAGAGGGGGRPPVASGSSILSFEVVERVDPSPAG